MGVRANMTPSTLLFNHASCFCARFSSSFIRSVTKHHVPTSILKQNRRIFLANAQPPTNESETPKPLHQDQLPDAQSSDQLLPAVDAAATRLVQNGNVHENPALSQLQQKQRKAHEKHLQRLENLSSLPADLVAETTKNACSGCGALVQSQSPDLPGFLPLSVIEKQIANLEVPSTASEEDSDISDSVSSGAVCQRCYRLTHYGAIEQHLRVPPRSPPGNLRSSTELSPDKFRQKLERLRKINCVIIYLMDIFDFQGSFIPSIRNIVGSKNPIFIAINKFDLLPSDVNRDRVGLWIRHECAEMGLENVAGLHLISSTKSMNIEILLDDAVRIAKTRRADIYVIGAANVGKSTFINQLIRMRRNEKSKTSKRRGKFVASREVLTTSVVPGTTLDVIKIPLGSNTFLHDTPGIMMPHQLTNYLDSKDLRAVLPSKGLQRTSLRLGEGKTLFLGGLARIEILSGRPFFFTTFLSPEVKIHPGKSEDAALFIETHVGGLLTPPSSSEALARLGEWTSKSFQADGEGWKKSCVDVVLSGLGWVALTGSGSIQLRVWVPRGVGVFTRESLMPFEVQKGVSTYTGSKAVNMKQQRKKQRY